MIGYELPAAKRNQLANTQNKYQGSAVKALCVCSAGLLRSPSIAKVLTECGYNTRACGTAQDYALIPVSEALLYWADEIYVVAEESVIIRALLKEHLLEDVPVVELDIPDEYGTFDPALMDIIKEQVRAYWDEA